MHTTVQSKHSSGYASVSGTLRVIYTLVQMQPQTFRLETYRLHGIVGNCVVSVHCICVLLDLAIALYPPHLAGA
jgi:hypothetical protein